METYIFSVHGQFELFGAMKLSGEACCTPADCRPELVIAVLRL